MAQPPGGKGNMSGQAARGEFYISGQVLEEKSGVQLEYVNVAVYALRDSSLVSGTITDEKGKFNIKLSRVGRYYLTADFIGYEKIFIENIGLKPGKELLNLGVVEIKPSMIGIDEVEVVAEQPFVRYKLDRKVVDVSRNPSAQGGTAVDALENVPSIEIDIEGNVAVRGSTDFTVLIDGRQSPLTGSDALNQIPASAISQIEIITNPSVKFDPDGTAGILNIITKKGKLQGHSMVANASMGSSPQKSADVSYSYRAKKYTFTGSAGFRDREMQFESRDERETTADSLPEGDNKSYIYTNRDGTVRMGNYYFKGAFDYNLSDANTITIGGSFNNFFFARSFDSKINSITPDTVNFRSDIIEYKLSDTDFKVEPVTWQINIGDKHIFKENKDHYLSADLMYQWRDNSTTDSLQKRDADLNWNPQEDYAGGFALTKEDAIRARIEVNYSLPVTDNFLIETGYTYRSDAYTQVYNNSYQDGNHSDSLSYSEYSDIAEYNRTINAGWFLGRGKYRSIQYSAGLRLEHTDRNITTEKDGWDYNYNYLGWYPSLSLAKEWRKGHLLQTSYSKRINRPRGYHLNPFPSLSDGYVQFVPNPELEPEYASSVELNYQKKWGQSFLAAETFYRYTDNEMDRVTKVNGDTLVRTIMNLGYESDAGGELALNLKISKWWTFNPSAVISYNQISGTYENEDRTTSSVNYRGGLNNNFFLPTKTRIQLMSHYRGARKEIDGTREPSYWVSASVRQDFFDRKLSVTLRVDDMFSTRRREGYTYTETTTVYSVGQRKSPTFVLALSYKINPTNDKKRNNQQNGNSGDGMDVGF